MNAVRAIPHERIYNESRNSYIIVGNGAFTWTNKSLVGYYPANNSTWTNIVTSSEFGGGIFAWKTPCSGEHKLIQVVKEDYTCEDCKLGGTYEEVVNCTQCGIEMSRIIKKIPAKEHSWDNGTITREVTAKCDGKKIYDWKLCF